MTDRHLPSVWFIEFTCVRACVRVDDVMKRKVDQWGDRSAKASFILRRVTFTIDQVREADDVNFRLLAAYTPLAAVPK